MSYKHLFRRFLDANPERLHFAAHSHHLWPDVTFEAQQQAWLSLLIHGTAHPYRQSSLHCCALLPVVLPFLLLHAAPSLIQRGPVPWNRLDLSPPFPTHTHNTQPPPLYSIHY